ncbi:MAG: hypothetical protein JNL82_21205 [Myxococcales bacterium]|nr:hypothetical protein [Myxococcales bacterium]
MGRSRREFSTGVVAALTAYGLIEGLWARDLWASSIKPTIGLWLRDLVAMAKDLRGRRLTDLEFQGHLEELFKRVDLEALVKLIRLDEVERRLVAGGSTTQEVGLQLLDGLPAGAGFNRRIFACSRGRSIAPHGHVNMCSGFLIIKGAWRGRHYARVETHAQHCVIVPTIDEAFVAGDASTISDHRDNVHWFVADSPVAYIFNVHVAGYDPDIAGAPGRIYLDPDGERLAGGRIRAPRMSGAACRAKYP